jgi:hypothetical protein
MTMVAVSTFGAADSSRRGIALMFRESGFDRKTMPVAYTAVFISHSLDHSVSRIKRIKSHVVFFLPRQRYSRPVHRRSFDLHAALTPPRVAV